MTTISKLIQLVDNFKVMFFVDFGVSCYSTASVSEILLEKGGRGLIFECDPKKHPIQHQKMIGKKASVLPIRVTPDNISNILRDHNVFNGFYLS